MNRIICTLTLTLGLIACGGTSDTNLESAFCMGLGSDPVATITAGAEPESAPPAALGDLSTEVTLVGGGAQNVGSIVYTADEAGHFAFGLSADVPFVIRDTAGSEISLARTVRGSEQCTELAVRHTAPLEISKSYTITFGPTDVASINVVAEESNDDLTP